MICPKCGMEFKDGIVNCIDCGTVLVQDLKETKAEMVPLLSLPSDYADRLRAYFIYSDIEVQAISNKDAKDEKILMVKASQRELATKHASVFLSQEPVTKNVEKELDNTEPEDFFFVGSDAEPAPSKTAHERYNEAMSTASTFGGCAIILALLIFDQFVTHFLPSGSIMTNIIFIGITAAMLFGCAKYFSIAKKMQQEVAEEGEQQVNIRTWLQDKAAEDVMPTLLMEQFGSQFEGLLIERERYLLGILRHQFPDANLALLEAEAEKFLDELDAQTENENAAEENTIQE